MIAFDHKPGLVAYLTCGDPDLGATRAVALAAIDAGADVVELGVPFSDPIADGPVIQRASERALQARKAQALENGRHKLQELLRRRPHPKVLLYRRPDPSRRGN